MGIVILIALVVGAFVLFSFGSGMLRMNKEPEQGDLAAVLINAVASSETRADAKAKIGSYLDVQGWDRVEQARRMAHAVSMVKVLHPPAYNAVLDLYRSYAAGDW
jgi:hypothetical protein